MNEFERRKRQVGMAPPGSAQYARNAAYILGANPNNPSAEQKLRQLAQSGDAETRRAAQSSLRGASIRKR